MYKIAVFLKDGALHDFFGANMFRVFSETGGAWNAERDEAFEAVAAGSPGAVRSAAGALPPLISDCRILAGGALVGIPYLIFNRAGLHIFEIREMGERMFHEMAADVRSAEAELLRLDGVIRDAKPVETRTAGVYVLDLAALQTEFPEISSKKALSSFLEDTPFAELRLLCRHVPPWIENSGKYDIATTNRVDGNVLAVISPMAPPIKY